MMMSNIQIFMSNTAGFVQIVNAQLSMPNVYVTPIINVYSPTIYAPAFYAQTTNILQQQAQQNMLPGN